jgi:hypothetical protein
MPEQDLPIVRYKTEEAAAVADLLSIQQDLLRTKSICERLKQVLRAGDGDSELVDALWTAALIRYARCFMDGKRSWLSPEILSHLPGDPIGAHNYYKNQRDKLVAHSANPFEECLIGLVLSRADFEPRQVRGIADLYVRFISGDEKSVQQLAALARELIKVVEKKIREGKSKLLTAASNEPVDDLYRLEPMEFAPPGPELAGRRRK